MKDSNKFLEDGNCAEKTEFQMFERGILIGGQQPVVSYCGTLESQELEGADTAAAEICEELKRVGLAGSLYKKLNYQFPSSSCLVRQLSLHLLGRTPGIYAVACLFTFSILYVDGLIG